MLSLPYSLYQIRVRLFVPLQETSTEQLFPQVQHVQGLRLLLSHFFLQLQNRTILSLHPAVILTWNWPICCSSGREETAQGKVEKKKDKYP